MKRERRLLLPPHVTKKRLYVLSKVEDRQGSLMLYLFRRCFDSFDF